MKTKWLPWALVAFLVIFSLIQNQCEKKIQKDILIQSGELHQENKMVHEENRGLLKKFENILESSDKKIQDALDQADETDKKLKKIKVATAAEIQYLKNSNKSWESKFLILEDEYKKLLVKYDLVLDDRDNLIITVKKLKIDVKSLTDINSELWENNKILEDNFNKQYKLTMKAKKNKCLLEKGTIVAILAYWVYDNFIKKKGD